MSENRRGVGDRIGRAGIRAGDRQAGERRLELARIAAAVRRKRLWQHAGRRGDRPDQSRRRAGGLAGYRLDQTEPVVADAIDRH